jgi:Fe-coproporphyrin III synthase
MLGPTGESRVIQIHPTRRCNLRCKHCYSASGPDVRVTLPVETILETLDDAAQQGYNVLGISGGEPTLYRGLAKILLHARALGLVTTVTTNGMLLTNRAIQRLAGTVNLIAISLDGTPTSHNVTRGSSAAFETMCSRLDGLRRFNIPFGFIFTLTQFNVHELDWVTTFAVDQEASLVQVHPLEDIGRAKTIMRGSVPVGPELAWAYAEVARLRERFGETIRLQLDTMSTKVLARNPFVGFAEQPSNESAFVPLSEILSPLVVEADGTVVPLQYGLDRMLSLGNVRDSRLSCLASDWIRDGGHRRFLEVCQRAYVDIASDTEGPPLVNWYERVGDLSHRLSRSMEGG